MPVIQYETVGSASRIVCIPLGRIPFEDLRKRTSNGALEDRPVQVLPVVPVSPRSAMLLHSSWMYSIIIL
jgi:hypothetical protein